MRNIIILIGVILLIVGVLALVNNTGLLSTLIPTIVSQNVRYIIVIGIAMILFGYLGLMGLLVSLVIGVLVVLGGVI